MVHRLKGFSLMLLLIVLLAACGTTAEPTATTATGGTGGTGDSTAAQPTTPATGDAGTTTQPADGDQGQIPDLGGRKLIVGSDTTYPPMEFVDENREVVGFDVDMARAMGELINAQFEFITFPNFDAIFAALSNGEFDLVISSVSITEERKKIIDFSDPYLSVGQAIAVQEANTTIKSVEDLKGSVLIGVQGGTTGEQAIIDAGVPETNIRRYDTIDLAFQDLASGGVDAVVADGPPVAQYTQEMTGLKIVGEPFTTEDYAIALQKGDDELRQAINAALTELKANGTLDQLLEKWNLKGAAKLAE